MKLQRYSGNPILSPLPGSPWQNLVTTNPGAWYDEATGVVTMLYRAAGDNPEHRVHLGLATSTDGYNFTRASAQPVLSPSVDGFDGGCIEDPRIIKLGDWYYITYAARPFPPGEYWLGDKRSFFPPEMGPDAPWTIRTNQTSTGLALTKDFQTWVRAGRMTNPSVDDRDVILFPEKIDGQYVLLHRPMNWTGPEYGCEYPAMWIAFSDDLLVWTNSKLLAKAQLPWENRKIGGNTPPIKTDAGWIHIYHAVGEDRHYRLGAFLLDLHDPSKIIGRTRDWILQPEEPYELEGFYPGVCFPCGNVVIDGTLFVYYGGADKYVGVATCPLADLVDYLLACPAE